MCGGFKMAEWCDVCTLSASVTLLCSEISEKGNVEVIAVESGKRIWIESREDLVVHSTSYAYACVLVPELKDGMTHQICGLLFADWAQVLLDRNHLFEAIALQLALESSALRRVHLLRSLQKQRYILNVFIYNDSYDMSYESTIRYCIWTTNSTWFGFSFAFVKFCFV